MRADRHDHSYSSGGTFRIRDLEFEGFQRVGTMVLQDGGQVFEVQVAPLAAGDAHNAELSQGVKCGGDGGQDIVRGRAVETHMNLAGRRTQEHGELQHVRG